jgi:hypothetical protein
MYRRGEISTQDLCAYVDADWGTNVDTRRSVTGYVTLYNNTPISWKSKNQQTVALSSAEAEYMAASEISKEVIYLRRLLQNMRFVQGPPTVAYEDNTACIEWGNNVVGGRERAKHIGIRKHFANDAIQDGQLTLVKISTANQLADIMTKALKAVQWDMCTRGLLCTPLISSKDVSVQEGEKGSQ